MIKSENLGIYEKIYTKYEITLTGSGYCRTYMSRTEMKNAVDILTDSFTVFSFRKYRYITKRTGNYIKEIEIIEN